MRAPAAIGWTALTLVAAVACSTFGEARVEEEPAPPASTSPDADAGDAAGASDGAAPACVRPPDAREVFCQDFEDPSLASPFGFDGIDGPELGSFTIDDAPLRPGKKALRIALAAGSGSRSLTLHKVLKGPIEGRYTLDFDVLVQRITVTYAGVGMIALKGPSYVAFPGVAIYTDGETSLGRLDPRMGSVGTNGGWRHVAVDLTIEAGSVQSAMAVDGTSVGGLTTGSVPQGTVAVVQIGAFFTGVEPGDLEVFVDDVVAIVR